jgi:flavin reductase (DIM6/NTAB) family NADH-FMN oxidoreductase RutF
VKEPVALTQAKWLIEPGCVILVTGGTMEKANVMTFSWQTPVNTADPCQVLLVMSHVRYTYELIKKNGELVINVPGDALLDQTHRVGTVTGRGIDKFARTGLTPLPANVVAPPLIAQCAGHLECRLARTVAMETHDLLICDVVHASADADLFDGAWIPDKFHTLHYLHGDKYGLLTRRVRPRGVTQ